MESDEGHSDNVAKGLRAMTRFQLRFAADGTHDEETREFEKRDGTFVFWLAETKDGREIDLVADDEPVCRLRRSRANKDFWIISKPSGSDRP
tara:strand:+ start:1205 stop:1480 length:276 start_codon:yes stop_codon:yes gene_type:complete